MIGGLIPPVATWLVERTGDEIAPEFLIVPDSGGSGGRNARVDSWPRHGLVDRS
jgi:hypothetical protein